MIGTGGGQLHKGQSYHLLHQQRGCTKRMQGHLYPIHMQLPPTENKLQLHMHHSGQKPHHLPWECEHMDGGLDDCQVSPEQHHFCPGCSIHVCQHSQLLSWNNPRPV